MSKDTPTTKNKKKSLKWRLTKAPTLEDVTSMLESNIITKEEAKELLFNLEDQNDKIKALEKQVEFLEGVVERLTEHQSPVIITKYIRDYDWPQKIYPTNPSRPYWLERNGDFYGTTRLVSNMMDAVGKINNGSSTLTLTSGGSAIS